MAYSKVFKTDAAYQLSVTFYDNSQRKCGELPISRTVIPDRTYNYTNFVTAINWTLSNAAALAEIPAFAYYYSVNITKCLRTRFFEQLRGRDATYVRKDQDGNYVFLNPDYAPTHAGCAFDISTLIPLNMGYAFAQGDVVKIYIGSSVYNVAIIGQEGNFIITELANMGTLNGATPFLFEIYTPYRPSTNEPGYEVAQIFPITGAGTAGREYSTLAGSIAGDVWLVTRNGLNGVYYTINPIDEERNDDEDATLGVLYVRQDAADTAFSTGSSPFRSLAGFDIATNTDRLIIKNLSGTDSLTFTLSGSITLRPDSDRTWRMYVSDNIGNATVLVPDTAMSANVVKTFNFDQTITLAPGNRLFVFHHQSVANSMYFTNVSVTIKVPSSAITYLAEAMSPNDKFYKNWYTDAGRPNFIDPIGQVVHTNTIAWSNTLADGTKNNGLSTYDALDTKPIPAECGAIAKLKLTSKVSNEQGVVMLGICSRETVSMYLAEVQLLGATKNADVAQTADVIGTINTLKGSFGTSNPESVVEYRGNVYWLDTNNGRYVQYSLNGLFPISNYRMARFWKLFSETYRSLTPQQIEALGSRPFVFSGIDPVNSELLISVPRVLAVPPKGYMPGFAGVPYVFDIWDGQEKCIVYKLNVEPNWWQGSIDAPAENFCYAGNQLWSFRYGQAYRHNSKVSLANYYGVQNSAQAAWVMNVAPNRPKVANNVTMESSRVPDITIFMTEYPYIQASELYPDNFEDREGLFYAAILRDKLTPGVTNALLKGERMRGTVLKIYAEWIVSGNNQVNFKFADIGFAISRGHTT